MDLQQYEKWKIVSDGIELVQLAFEANNLTARVQPFSSFMTGHIAGSEEPVTMPKEHADALVFILKYSNLEGFRNAKAVRA